MENYSPFFEMRYQNLFFNNIKLLTYVNDYVIVDYVIVMYLCKSLM